MHYWGDGFKYFEDVGNAAYEIGHFCRKWGRIQVSQTKEKYGTARVYCSLYCSSIHDLIYPGWGFYHFPRWTRRIFDAPIFKPFRFIISPYQEFIYRLAYKRAIKKYPHIKEEILDTADWYEYLKGIGGKDENIQS